MTRFDARAFKQWLEDHDVRLRPPDPAALRGLRAMFGDAAHPDVVAMYEAFDGCDRDDFEVNSFLTIWPLARGLAYSQEHGLAEALAIADIECLADVALCSVLEPSAPVRWEGDILPARASFGQFWGALMDGSLSC